MAMTAAEFRKANRGVSLQERGTAMPPQGRSEMRHAGAKSNKEQWAASQLGANHLQRHEEGGRESRVGSEKLSIGEGFAGRQAIAGRQDHRVYHLEEKDFAGSFSDSSDNEVGGLGALSSFSLPGGPRKPGPRTAMSIMLECEARSSARTGLPQFHPALPRGEELIAPRQGGRQVRANQQGYPFLLLGREQGGPPFGLAQGGNLRLDLDSPSTNLFEKAPWLAAGHDGGDHDHGTSAEYLNMKMGGGLTGLGHKVAADSVQPPFEHQSNNPFLQGGTNESAPNIRVTYGPGAMRRKTHHVSPSSTSVVVGGRAAAGSGARCPQFEPRNGRIRLESSPWSEPPLIMKDNAHANDPIEWASTLQFEREGSALHGTSVHLSAEVDADEPKIKSDVETSGGVGHNVEHLVDSPKAADGTPPRRRGQLWGVLLAFLAVLCPVGLFLLQ